MLILASGFQSGVRMANYLAVMLKSLRIITSTNPYLYPEPTWAHLSSFIFQMYL